MEITTVCRPGVVIPSMRVFAETCPGNSAALDRAVKGRPGEIRKVRKKGVYVNFDHHYSCSRLMTRATCMQSVLAIRGGILMPNGLFGGSDVTLHVQGADWDVSLSRTAFLRPDLAEHSHFYNLCAVEDLVDTWNGHFGFKNRTAYLYELVTIGVPWVELQAKNRRRGKLMPPGEYIETLDEMHRLTLLAVNGKGKRTEPDMSYKFIAEYERWPFVREDCPYARYGLARDGVNAYVTVAELGRGRTKRYEYRMIRRTEFVDAFGSFRSLRTTMNRYDGIKPGKDPSWGGTESCLCSPEGIGSKCDPETLAKILQANEAAAHRRYKAA